MTSRGDTCKCGTKAKKRPRCGKYRYRHKCPHGKWCAFGHRLVGWHAVSNIHCKECMNEQKAKRLANDEGYQRHLKEAQR